MELFHEIEDAFAIVCSKAGVYKQTKVYRRGRAVYFGHGSGFLRAFKNGGTSTPNVKWQDIDIPGSGMVFDNLGRMALDA